MQSTVLQSQARPLLFPEIDFDHLGVAKNRLCGAIRNLVAKMKNDQMAAQLGHHPDVMVDDADADTELMDAANELNQFGAFSFAESSGRFVQQQLRWMSPEGDGDS